MKQHAGRLSVAVIVTVLAVLLVPLGSVAAASPANARQAALVDWLTRSSDPNVTFEAMTSADKVLVIEYLTVTTTSDQSELAAAPSDSLSTAAVGCWTWTWQRDGKNALGATLWSYFQKIDWCGNGSTITNVPQRLRWGETYFPFWSWKHIGNQTWGGFGQASYRAWTQGEFKLCATPDVGCVQYSYPWLDMTAWADGRGTGSVGG